jgi:hypothetical protein
MSFTRRRKFLAAVVAATVVLGPALPALAAPDGWTAANLLARLTSWFVEHDAGRTQAGFPASEAPDPDGTTEQPQPPLAGFETTTTDGSADQGETLPDWDPDG